MNGKELLSGLGGIDARFYEEAENGVMNMTKKTRTLRGTVGKILIAAAIISALTVTASAAGLGWFQRYFEDRSRAPLSQTEMDFLDEMEQPINQSQTRDGYTLNVKSAITDGRMAYINIGITAPEGEVIGKTVIPGYDPAAPHIEAGNFGPEIFVPAQGYRGTGSMSLETLDDFDGRDNTQDWLLTVQKNSETPFAPGSVWKLHIENLVATYQNAAYQQELNEKSGSEPGTLMELTQEESEKLNPKVILAEGTWDFEIEFKECDTRAIEFIKEPFMTTCTSFGTDSAQDVKVTSLSLGTLGAVVLADTKEVPEFWYIQVVMKDGSEIRLLPGSGVSGQLKLKAARPIMLDGIDHIRMPDGTKLPMP